uniref:Uncharacterized protein n=1 Tax=Megaselia scalaris TaxID=36166 RepID=T1H760_MEGSC
MVLYHSLHELEHL